MSRILDSVLAGTGKALVKLADLFWWMLPWRQRKRSNHWAQMALTDGHGWHRNRPCMCGSGTKFKRCHGATRQQKAFWAQQYARHCAWLLERYQIRNIPKLKA